MTCWLYQMTIEKWPYERYRAEVWEGAVTLNWKVREIIPRKGMRQYGDIIIFYYIKSDKIDPGIYGWGVVLWCNGDDIHFRPSSPSDYLKMNPLWDKEVEQIIENIRGNWAEATMFEDKKDSIKTLRQKITQHVYGKLLSS